MTNPYWQGKYSTLYHGSCFDIMPELDQEIGMICIDPPYGKNWQSNYRPEKFDKIIDDEGEFDLTRLGTLCAKALKNFRHIYIFGFRPSEIPDSFQIGGSCELIWDKGKTGLGDLSSAWGPQHEIITFGVHVSGSRDRSVGRGNLSAKLRKGSILSFPRKDSLGVRNHPTEKPVPLIRTLIESSTTLGDIVLDPCSGAGSTMVAASIEGRLSIGIEREEKHCETAARRMEKAERVIEAIKSI